MTRTNLLNMIAPQTPPTITSPPQSTTRNVGETATFTVTATGTNRSYRWQWRNPSGAWQNVVATGGASGITTRTLQQTNVQSSMDGWTYRVIITNAAGSVTSNTVRLSVLNLPGTFRVSRANTFVGTTPNGNQIATIGTGGTFTRNGEVTIAGNWTWLRGRLTGTSVNSNTLVWIATTQLERHAGTNGIQCQITDPQRFGFTSVRNIPTGPNIFNFSGNATFRPVGQSATASGFTWRLGTIIGSNISALNGTTVWVASTQFATNSHTICR